MNARVKRWSNPVASEQFGSTIADRLDDEDRRVLRFCDCERGGVLEPRSALDEIERWGALEDLGLLAHVGFLRYRTTKAGLAALEQAR